MALGRVERDQAQVLPTDGPDAFSSFIRIYIALCSPSRANTLIPGRLQAEKSCIQGKKCGKQSAGWPLLAEGG